MDTIVLDKDIVVMYVPATSFPAGIQDAHDELHALVPATSGRHFYGVSRPEGGEVQYKAAAEVLHENEAAQLNLGTLTIKRGSYRAITLHNFADDVQSIGRAFQQILDAKGLDPQGYCVEYYLNEKDVQCMVRLADNE